MAFPALYPILDTEALTRRHCRVETAALAFLEGGAEILQLRHKGHFSREVLAEAELLAGLCASHGTLLVIDDRADIAMLLDAGLHVGQDDLPPNAARGLIGPDRLLGYSTHNAEQFALGLEEPADYLALGPIFSTGSKLNPDPVVGIEGLRLVRGSTGRPLVAIGGITRRNAREALAAGAASVAVIADLLPETCTYTTLRARMEEWQQLVRG